MFTPQKTMQHILETTPEVTETKSINEMTSNTTLRTSLTRETLLLNFEDALDLNIKAKKRYCKHEIEYSKLMGSNKRLTAIVVEMAKLSPLQKKIEADAKRILQYYTEANISFVLRQIQNLQSEAQQFVEKTNANKEKRRQASQSFGSENVIEVDESEKQHAHSGEPEISNTNDALFKAEGVIDVEEYEKQHAEPTRDIIMHACKLIWSQINQFYAGEHNGKFEIVVYQDPSAYFESAFQKMVVDNVCYETEKELERRIRFKTLDVFTDKMIAKCFKKFGIGCANVLLENKRPWVHRNVSFSKALKINVEIKDEKVKEYSRDLVCKAIVYENVIKYAESQVFKLPDDTYDEVIEFLKEYSPAALEDLMT